MTTASVGYAEIDASTLSAADRLPSVCSRHGEDSRESATFNILSKPPPSPGPKFAYIGYAGVLAMVNELAWFFAKLKVTKVENWPMCVRCRRRRRAAQATTKVLLWGGLMCLLGAIGGGLVYRAVTGDYAPTWVLAPMLGGLAAMLLSAVPASWGRQDRIARAATSKDGAMVWFTRPHPRFADQMRATFGTQWRVQAQAPEQPPHLH